MRLTYACRLLAAAGFCLAVAVPAATTPAGAAGTAAGGSAGLGRAAPGQAVAITLSSLSPAIVAPGQTLTVAGTLRNLGRTALPRPTVTVRLGSRPLAGRADVAAWAQSSDAATGRRLGVQQLSTPLASGASARFQVTVTGVARLRQAAYGAVPLSVEADGQAVHTFAGYQQEKQYVPLKVAWLVPIGLPPDPALFGGPGEDRDRAWSKALGSGSAVDNILTGTASAPVTWAIDPTLLPNLRQVPALPAQPTPAAGPSPSSPATPPEGGAIGSGTERRLRAAVADRIRRQASAHVSLVLPEADADIAAAVQLGSAVPLIRSQVQAAAPIAAQFGARADIAWPADGRGGIGSESELRSLYAGHGPAATIAAQSQLPQYSITADAARRSADGLPVLGYDDALSATFGATGTAAAEVLSAQQFIADSVVLLDESPGLDRRVLVAAPRGFDPGPGALSPFFATVAAIPWIQPTSTDALVAAAAKAAPMPRPNPSTTGTATAPTTAPIPAPTTAPTAVAGRPATASPPVVLTAARAAVLDQALRRVEGIGMIRADGAQFARIWTESADQLTSCRWRGPPGPWEELQGEVKAAAARTTSGLRVSPSTVNFLADSGRVQITVLNTLDVAVHDITLTVTPDNPRLRVDEQPTVLHIGARSRTTVTAKVTSLAAGLVPLRATLTAPDGAVVGRGAAVQITVTPTGAWVYWTLGGIAGTILFLGIWRTVRQSRAGDSRAAAAAAAAKESAHP